MLEPMAIPTLCIVATPEDSTAEIVVHGVVKGAEGPETSGFDSSYLERLGLSGARDEVARAVQEDRSLVFVGLGDKINSESLRAASAVAVRALGDVPSLVLALPVDNDSDARAVLEGAALGAYAFVGEKSKAGDKEFAKEVHVAVGEAHVSDTAVRHARVLADAVHRSRDLGNTPPNILTPAAFADRVVAETTDLPVTVTVLDEQQLRDGGFGGIVGVGQGSQNPPRLVVVDYNPGGASKHLAIIGKGITFDTGGISLKPASAMLGMKLDMSGAGTAYAAAVAAAELGLPLRITAYLCLAENMPSASAIKPEDVIRIRGGKSVEVTNTDAEGRLVMADGLQYATEQSPDAIIDIATLTGAQQIALGNRYSGLMGNDDALTDAFVKAVAEADEQAWPMPLPEELGELLKSPVADIANARPGKREGGMLVAGIFLREFVSNDEGEEFPWLHIDIAGPANNEGSAYGWNAKGATGVMVRSLVGFAADFARNESSS